MAFTGLLEDRLLIRERYGAYSDAACQDDVEAYIECWSDNCVRIANGTELRGKPALREHWGQARGSIERMAFFTEIGAIDVRGDVATARVYCREIIFLKDGGLWKVVGIYTDELEREAGQWRFSCRKYQLFMNESGRAKP